MKHLPENDGIDHINVYSKGKTELGRLLSNFAHTPIELPLGKFESVEGLWYYIMTGDDRLKSLWGFSAKKLGRELPAIRGEPSKEELYEVYRCKANQHPNIRALLIQNILPFTHYYMFGDKQVTPTNYQWTATLWENFR